MKTSKQAKVYLNPLFLAEMLVRRWKETAAVFLILTAAFSAALFMMPPVYEAAAEVSVLGDTSLAAEAVKVTNRTVLKSLARRQNLISEDAGEREKQNALKKLAGKISVKPEKEKSLLRITVRDTDPENTALLANSTADYYRGYVYNVELKRDISIKTLKSAVLPEEPLPRNLPLRITLAAIASLLAALIFALIREIKEGRVKSEEEIKRLAGGANLYSMVRSVSTGIFEIGGFDLNELPKVLLVSGPERKTENSTLISLFSEHLARSGKRILVIDFELERPRLHKIFGIGNLSGLTNIALREEALSNWREFVCQSEKVEGVDILTAGPVPPSAGRITASRNTAFFIEQAASQYDHVLLYIGMADAENLEGMKSLSEYIILSAEVGSTGRGFLADEADALRKMAGKIRALGVLTDLGEIEKREKVYTKVKGGQA